MGPLLVVQIYNGLYQLTLYLLASEYLYFYKIGFLPKMGPTSLFVYLNKCFFLNAELNSDALSSTIVLEYIGEIHLLNN